MRNVSPSKVKNIVKPVTIVIVIAIIGILILLGTSFYIVQPTEEAVVSRFGKYLVTNGPGLHYKLPLGIDQHIIVRTTEVQTEEFGFRTERSGVATRYSDASFFNESNMLTGDLNIVDIEWIIQYRISDPKAWAFNVQDRIKTIRDISQSAMNMYVGDKTIMRVMGSDRTTIETEVLDMMNNILTDYGLGITVITVQLQNIFAPAGVQEAFDDVNKAKQDMNRFINEGKEAYNREIPRARGEGDRLEQVARGYAAERINKAKGDIARFESIYEEYKKAKNVTRERLYFEMMEEIFKASEDTILIDKDIEGLLPLMNLNTKEGNR